MKSDEAKPSADVNQAVDPNLRREYELKKKLIQAGVEKSVGDKVNLNDRQAEQFRKSGHIA